MSYLNDLYAINYLIGILISVVLLLSLLKRSKFTETKVLLIFVDNNDDTYQKPELYNLNKAQMKSTELIHAYKVMRYEFTIPQTSDLLLFRFHSLKYGTREIVIKNKDPVVYLTNTKSGEIILDDIVLFKKE